MEFGSFGGGEGGGYNGVNLAEITNIFVMSSKIFVETVQCDRIYYY